MKYYIVVSIIAVVFGITVALGVTLSMTPQANAQVSCGVYFCELLEQILQEEQKQTALLDHIDCRNNYYYLRDVRYYCGDPLNVTGVWTP